MSQVASTPIIITNTISLTSSIVYSCLKRLVLELFVVDLQFYICYCLQRFARNCPTVCVTRAGRAAGRRPIGKMMRRRKLLGIAPESPASGARFVGQCTEHKACFLKKKHCRLTDEIIAHTFYFGNHQTLRRLMYL
jgi:hypothetical protein